MRALGVPGGHEVARAALGCLVLEAFEELESAWLGCWLEPAGRRIDILDAAWRSPERRPEARANGVLHGRPIAQRGLFLGGAVSIKKEPTDGRLAAERALARTMAPDD